MASDLRGYTEQEVLNKVLNTSSDSIKVDIVSGSEYAEDAAHTTADVGQFVLGVRNDTLAALGGTDGDYVPFQMNASGALYVEIASGGSADAAHVDDAGFTLGTHSGMMMMGFAGTQSVDANDAGAIAMETDGSVHIHDGGNTITVDGTVTANLGTTDNAVLDAIAASLALLDNSIASGNELQVDVVASLPAGSAAIGKLAANSGVDIGDVDVTSVTTGYAAANLGKREDDVHANQDVGVMALAVRNDDVAALGSADGDYAPLQVNAAGSLYTKDETGEAGSILVTGTGTVTTTVTANTVFVAIQFIEDSVFDSDNSTGLVSATDQLYPSSEFTSTSVDADAGAVSDSVTFPQGMTIFGRWSGFKLASGKVIAYIAHV
jgi:hypothetical protein